MGAFQFGAADALVSACVLRLVLVVTLPHPVIAPIRHAREDRKYARGMGECGWTSAEAASARLPSILTANPTRSLMTPLGTTTTMMTNPVVVATPTGPVIAPKACAPQLSAVQPAAFGRVRVPAAVVLTLFPVLHSIDGRSVGPGFSVQIIIVVLVCSVYYHDYMCFRMIKSCPICHRYYWKLRLYHLLSS